MSKIKSALLALVMALAVAVGGVTAAAPAQAVMGTSVDFYHIGAGVPSTIDLYNTHMSGATTVQAWGTTSRDVRTTCPKNDNWKIAWVGDGGKFNFLDPGQCKTWQTDGRKDVGVFTADQNENI